MAPGDHTPAVCSVCLLDCLVHNNYILLSVCLVCPVFLVCSLGFVCSCAALRPRRPVSSQRSSRNSEKVKPRDPSHSLLALTALTLLALTHCSLSHSLPFHSLLALSFLSQNAAASLSLPSQTLPLNIRSDAAHEQPMTS